ncbi:SDR family NAD(P)-dependent oxidoreductase, partial [Wenjunlia tyrosinilytica]|uniref:SDR family NAD(P)-dependent oxidoreductase n=1 Tax=Wenjunlia tyrosinilytica TaxID=1544741 RepID=UPI00166AF350
LGPAGDPVELPSVVAGKRFALVGDGEGVAGAVRDRLAALGATSVALGAGHPLVEEDTPVDGVLYLEPLAPSEFALLPDAFPVLRGALLHRPRWLIAARPVEGEASAGNAAPGAAGGQVLGDAAATRAAGLNGLFRTVAREYPDTVARVVEIEGGGRLPPGEVADLLLSELLADGSHPVVRLGARGRYGLELTESVLGPLGAKDGDSLGAAGAEAPAGLDRESVVLLVGGGRGITASFARVLARTTGCRIELAGRTPAPCGPQDPATWAAGDRADLRAVLARDARGRSPAEIDQAAGRILAQREIRATLEELEGFGSAVRYRCADFRDAGTVFRTVKEIYAEHGRLDGVVFAAGVLEDRLIADKSPESFRRVFGTKAGGARELLDALTELPEPPGWVVLFGSISGVLGNRGQADYAAANDALECLGGQWAARTGRRALTVHWGPWAPDGAHSGMVTPELAREYARRGIGLIDPQEGSLALLRELAQGDASVDSVVYTASGR